MRLLLLCFVSLLASACVSETGDQAPTTTASPDPVSPDLPPIVLPAPEAPSVTTSACSGGCGIVEVMAGLTHSCALREDGAVLCWGGNAEGQLGDGRSRHGDCSNAGDPERIDCSARPVLVTGLSDVATLGSRGGLSTCALDRDGGVHCWGLESVPPVVGGGPHERDLPERVPGLEDIVDLADGFGHGCAVTADGSLHCFGRNHRGQLGTGDTRARRSPVRVDLPPARDVEVAVMEGFSCALTDVGAYCWGDNASGQLADGRFDHDRCANGIGTTDCAFTPVRVEALDEAVALSLGARHGCALGPDGRVSCWGDGSAGQLGDGGEGMRAEPAPVEALDRVVQLSAGGFHTCALRDDGRVLCWGANDEGQLGDGTLRHEGDRCRVGDELLDCVRSPVEVAGLDDAVVVSAGARHTCALRVTGEVVCWGWSADHQLGDGDRHRNAAPVRVEGLDEPL